MRRSSRRYRMRTPYNDGANGMGELGAEATIVRPAPPTDHRRVTVDEASPVSADMHTENNRGVATKRRQSFATVLTGQGHLFREGLKHILDKSDFDVVASGSSVDELALAPLLKHQPLLLIADAADDPQTAIRQMQLFKQRHPAARIAIVIHTGRMTDIALLFQAGANACFLRGATSLTFLKSLELVMLG